MGVEKVSEIIFSALVLIISAGVTAHILQGYGSNKWKESFLAIILAMACLTQVWKISQEQLNMTINRCTFLLMLLLMFL
jgi:membrane protein YdbS with pleckstrin-like domain